MMTDEDAKTSWKPHDIHAVEIRTVLTCHAHSGVCAKCYGMNLANGQARAASARRSASSPPSPSASPAPS